MANVGETLGIAVEAIPSSGYSTGCAGGTFASLARGPGGRFVPAGICWVVERSFAWLSRYRRLNTIFERSKDHLISLGLLKTTAKRLLTAMVTLDSIAGNR